MVVQDLIGLWVYCNNCSNKSFRLQPNQLEHSVSYEFPNLLYIRQHRRHKLPSEQPKELNREPSKQEISSQLFLLMFNLVCLLETTLTIFIFSPKFQQLFLGEKCVFLADSIISCHQTFQFGFFSKNVYGIRLESIRIFS